VIHIVEDPYRAVYSADVYVPEMEGLRDEMLNDAVAALIV
jgi:hypothetical protein